jgi:hypothetical protein
MKEARADDGPTLLGFLLKLPQEVFSKAASVVKTGFYRLVYPDLERQRKQIQVEREKQGLAQERLVTFEKAVDVGEKITDPKLRELFLQGLRSSLETSSSYPEFNQIGSLVDKTK